MTKNNVDKNLDTPLPIKGGSSTPRFTPDELAAIRADTRPINTKMHEYNCNREMMITIENDPTYVPLKYTNIRRKSPCPICGSTSRAKNTIQTQRGITRTYQCQNSKCGHVRYSIEISRARYDDFLAQEVTFDKLATELSSLSTFVEKLKKIAGG